jgi:hypothetical protein
VIVGLFSMAQNATVTPPAGLTERFDAVANTGTYPVMSEGADFAQSTLGPTGDLFATANRAGWSIGQLVGLRRAPA